jgi:CheY-like chemotaxis protein
MARILLADDDAAARDLVQRALASDGHSVVATHDGQEALEKLQSGATFDLLISDVQMPAVDGIELIEKAVAIAPGMRVILMSGFAGELDRAAHLKSKIAYVISKPFTLEQVRGVVRSALA